MKPKLEILPPAQLKLWPLLKTVPENFILYGGTAIALQLGHRESIDFDFFCTQTLNKNLILEKIPFLQSAKIVQPEINTLDCYVGRGKSTVKIQFLGGIDGRQGRVDKPLRCNDNGIYVASLRDLLASKLNTIQLRAEIKDYLDVDAILESGICLEEGLGCAQAIFGQSFDPGSSIRALCSYRDGDLAQVPANIQKKLTKTALAVESIPVIKAISKTIS